MHDIEFSCVELDEIDALCELITQMIPRAKRVELRVDRTPYEVSLSYICSKLQAGAQHERETRDLSQRAKRKKSHKEARNGARFT